MLPEELLDPLSQAIGYLWEDCYDKIELPVDKWFVQNMYGKVVFFVDGTTYKDDQPVRIKELADRYLDDETLEELRKYTYW